MNVHDLYCFQTILVLKKAPAANLKGNKHVKIGLFIMFDNIQWKKAPAVHHKRNKNEAHQSSPELNGIHTNHIVLT